MSRGLMTAWPRPPVCTCRVWRNVTNVRCHHFQIVPRAAWSFKVSWFQDAQASTASRLRSSAKPSSAKLASASWCFQVFMQGLEAPIEVFPSVLHLCLLECIWMHYRSGFIALDRELCRTQEDWRLIWWGSPLRFRKRVFAGHFVHFGLPLCHVASFFCIGKIGVVDMSKNLNSVHTPYTVVPGRASGGSFN